MVVQRRVLVSGFVLFLLFVVSLEQTSPPSSAVDRAALLELRSSLGLRARDWPIKTDPCASWVGVECKNGSVIGVNISGFKRTRIGRQNPQFSVDSLANLTSLEVFNASSFELPGWIPEWFGQRLSTLKVLDLRSCSLIGAIPQSIGDLSNLTQLFLSNNKLTGLVPSSLGQLSRLWTLDLSKNSLTGSIVWSFSSFGNLSILDISSNFLSGSIPSDIGKLLKLQYLNFSSNSLSSTIPSEIGDLVSLVDLDLSLNSLSGSLPVDLRGLRSLRKMVVRNNMLSGSLADDLFPSLTQLQSLVLSGNGFSGALPNVLWSLPTLQFLDISGNNFTGVMPMPNVSSIANASVAIFNLSGNSFYGNLTSLPTRFSFIDLSENYFEGKVSDYARSNASLTTNCLQNVSSQRTSVECASFYADRGLTFDNFGLPNAPSRSGGKSNLKWIMIGVFGGIGFIILVVVLGLLIQLCLGSRQANQRGGEVGPVPTGGSSPPPPAVAIDFSSLGEVFTYQQLLEATGDFDELNLIKRGHSGDLFKGILEGGIHVVIKRINLQSFRKEGYLLELDLFSKVSHSRIVPLIGHCLENENEKLLVYKYMPNGDLSNSLFRKTGSEDDSLQSLDWITRLKIATGAAESLSYLHHECTPPLVHRDVQASSILLDDKFEVRLGSLSEVCAQEGDAHQSVITRLLRLPQSSDQGPSGLPTATCAYDVYCFGKVLLELVTGKIGISASSDASMKEWFDQILPYISIYDKELVTKIVDPSLIIHEDHLEEVWAMAIVARSCLNPKPSRRPLMRYILRALENPLKVVREESSSGSARLRETSSRGSWNAALFGSWRHSSSDVAAMPMAARAESSLKHSGTTTGSHGSGPNGGGGGGGGGGDLSSSQRRGGGDFSSSQRRSSKEVFPEPHEAPDVERQV